jgi:hypothetical protein
MKRSVRAVITGSGTEPSSSTVAPARATRIPDHTFVKFMHHNRLMMDELKLDLPDLIAARSSRE